MSDTVIRVENLGKKYVIDHQQSEGYTTLRDSLTKGVKNILNPLKDSKSKIQNPKSEEFWALKDVSFEIKQGDRVGIIGRNGAGKSTLLKILSRITEPTEGRIRIQGRVASLLEVGTGFHPELTGRENIFLNGAVLGMSKVEIKRKFDEIVAFAEVEKFLDTPVKRYSSGMYVRLAFAVAAHLEPEVLIVDEVLAVGDAQFQKKCLGKMESVAEEGRTILFVSHNMAAIQQLCPSSILLKQGQLAGSGFSKELIDDYLGGLSSSNDDLRLEDLPERSGDGRLRFTAAYLLDESGNKTKFPISGNSVDIVLEILSYETLSHVQFSLTIYNHLGVAVTNCTPATHGKSFNITERKGQIVCTIPKLPLPPGQYRIAASAHDDIGLLDLLPNVHVFDVEVSNFFPTSYVPPIEYSTVLVEHFWKFRG